MVLISRNGRQDMSNKRISNRVTLRREFYLRRGQSRTIVSVTTLKCVVCKLNKSYAYNYVYDMFKMNKRINCWTINSLYYAMNTLPYHIKKRIQIPVLHRLYIFLLAGFVA